MGLDTPYPPLDFLGVAVTSLRTTRPPSSSKRFSELIFHFCYTVFSKHVSIR